MISLNEINAAILVGGLGTRLRSVVSDKPKALAFVRGKPALSYILDQLENTGLRRVVLCTGYKGDMILDAFGYKYGQIDLTYSQESEPLGTAGALRNAVSLFDSEDVLVLNGDTFLTFGISELLNYHFSMKSRITILLSYLENTERYGRVLLNEDSSIAGFSEKQTFPGPGWVNAGAYIISKEMLGRIPRGRNISLEKDIFPAWIGERFYGYKSEVKFLDFGTLESYKQAQKQFA